MAKWFFAIGVLLFVGKPFIGFAIEASANPPVFTILVKSFTKRKHEYVENSSFDIKTVQKKLADPINQLFLVVGALLALMLPGLADAFSRESSLLFRRLKLSPAPAPGLWLSHKQLLI